MVDLARDGDETGWRSNPGAVPAAARTAYARLSRGWEISDTDRATALPAAPDAAAERVASVDAVRGFAMFFIVAGDALAWALHDMALGREGPLSAVARFVSIQLQHAPWEGFRFYDFLFPLFIFVTGISIVFSLPGLVEREGEWAAHNRRSFLLFVLGLIYYGGAGNLWPEVRLVGVLQRIALCYLFVSLLFLHLNVRGLIVAFVSLLIGYWALMTFVSVPEVGAGSFTREANLARWIDAQYLPGLRLYGEWDPEGLLSTPPAVGTCLLGVFAGLLLRDTRVEPMQKALWLMGAGVVLVEAGYLWGLQFPVIKYIWTSSFVLVAGGYSALLLGMSYLLLDICGRKAWATVFLWFGANAILLYMFNNMVGFQNVAYKLVGGDIARFIDAQLTKGAASFVNVTVGITLAILLARYFYRRKIFLRV
ncbi:MAG: acyltransferase family protein [Xanthobacteraceae bacterium]